MVTVFTFAVDWGRDGVFVDETPYLRRVRVRSGFERPLDSVAAIGRCTVSLDNSSRRFSPGNAESPLAGKLVPRRPVILQATSGATTWTLFRGYIDKILPDAGRFSHREITLDCVDGLAILGRQRISATYEASKSAAAAAAAVVAAAYTPPATDYGDNGEVLEHYGRAWHPEETTCLDAMHDICSAVAGRFYLARDGTATFRTHESLQDPTQAPALSHGLTYSQALKLLRPGHLLGLWTLAEAGGLTAHDSSGNERDGAHSGAVVLGAAGPGDGLTAAAYGGTAFTRLYSTGLRDAFNGEAGTLMLWVRVTDPSVWSDGEVRYAVHLGDGAANSLWMAKTGAVNELRGYYMADGHVKYVVVDSGGATDWLCLAMTWSKAADEFKVFLNGAQVGSTINSLGWWLGVLGENTSVIGAFGVDASAAWKGEAARAALWDCALSPDAMAAAATIGTPGYADSMEMRLSVEDVCNLAQVTVYPVETVGVITTLWKAKTVLRLAPGTTRVIYAPFRDDLGERCGAVGVVSPVATTDYLVNDRRDGTGFNYTASPHFAISTVTEATRMRITLTNTAIGDLYVTLLQVRGKPLRIYDPVTVEASDSASQAAYEVRARTWDLKMQASENFADSLASYTVQTHAGAVLTADRLSVTNRDSLAGVNLFSVGLLDRLVIGEEHSGADSLAHLVRGVEYDISPGGFSAMLHLERAEDGTAWLLGVDGFSELGTATVLGF